MKFKYTKLPPTVQKDNVVYYLTKHKSFTFDNNKKKITIYHIKYENESKKQTMIPIVSTYDNKLRALMAYSYTEKEAYDKLLQILNNSAEIKHKSIQDFYRDSIENIYKKLREE